MNLPDGKILHLGWSEPTQHGNWMEVRTLTETRRSVLCENVGCQMPHALLSASCHTVVEGTKVEEILTYKLLTISFRFTTPTIQTTMNSEETKLALGG